MHYFDLLVKRGKEGVPFTENMEISPEMAQRMLTHNKDNRRLREVKVAQIVSDIVNGRWSNNGETIVVARDGSLNDGQHRLAAVVKSGVSIQTNITFGIERNTRFTLDQGANRSPGDHLGIMGRKHSNEIARTTRNILAYEANDGRSVKNSHKRTLSEIIDRAVSDVRIAASVEEMAAYPREATPARLSLLATWRYIIKDNDDYQAFLHTLASGENIAADSIPYKARLRLARSDVRTESGKTEIFMRAANAFVRGDHDNHIRLTGRIPAIGE